MSDQTEEPSEQDVTQPNPYDGMKDGEQNQEVPE